MVVAAVDVADAVVDLGQEPEVVAEVEVLPHLLHLRLLSSQLRTSLVLV